MRFRNGIIRLLKSIYYLRLGGTHVLTYSILTCLCSTEEKIVIASVSTYSVLETCKLDPKQSHKNVKKIQQGTSIDS